MSRQLNHLKMSRIFLHKHFTFHKRNQTINKFTGELPETPWSSDDNWCRSTLYFVCLS